MSRIAGTLTSIRSQRRPALVTFLTAGFPRAEATVPLVRALVAGGADLVELGVPFSDPLADGATIQRADYAALGCGVNIPYCLETARALREEGLEVPLLLMGYYNPILAYGPEKFVADASSAGIDGLIVVDLPVEESDELRGLCRPKGIDLVYLVAPTSSEERIEKIARLASGFVYCVSVAGVTGARGDLPAELPAFLARVRRSVDLPLAVGFGISRREHVESVAAMGADAAVVGSAIIEVIEQSDTETQAARVREYVEVLTGHGRAED